MKTPKLIIILALILTAFNVKSQFIDTTSAWRVNSYSGDPGIQTRFEFYRDYIDGDTIINSVLYSKIYKSGYGYFDWNPPYYFYFSHLFHGVIREESNKWYTYYNGADTLLYDFTLAVNDTVFSALTYSSQGPIIVTNIDSVIINSNFKKRFYLNIPFGAEYIIEDIGPNSGVLENMVFFEWGSKLICYAENNIPLWIDSTETCDLNVNIIEEDNGIGKCTISPNPAKDYTILSLTPEFVGSEISLVDMLGRIVFNKSKIEEKMIKISLSTLSPGFYILLVKNSCKHYKMNLIIN